MRGQLAGGYKHKPSQRGATRDGVQDALSDSGYIQRAVSRTSPIRVILADDHRLVRESLAKLLAAEDDVVVEAECADGEAALAAVRSVVPDVAVLDVSMPRLSGIEVMEALIAKSTTRFVILTALRSPELARRVLALGASAIVLKEDAFDDLLRAIRAAAMGRQFVSSALAGSLTAPGASERTPTARELEVLQLVAQGLTNKQVGTALGISPKTVDNHRTRVIRKLDAHSTADLVRCAIKFGLIDVW